MIQENSDQKKMTERKNRKLIPEVRRCTPEAKVCDLEDVHEWSSKDNNR